MNRKQFRYEIVTRDDQGRESVGRSGHATTSRLDILRKAFEREQAFAAEDGYEVLGIRVNGFSTLYTLAELEATA